MNVLGFEEADRAAERMLLPNRVEIRIPGIPSLLVLKLAAWGDKKRNKDATDIELLAAHYGDISQERLLGDEMTTYSDLRFDLVLAGATLLGRDARRVLDGPKCGESVQTLKSILEPEVNVDGQLRLATRMSASIDRSRQMLEQILRGLRQV